MLIDQAKKTAIDKAKAKQIKIEALANLTVTTPTGNIFDADTEAITNMLSAIEASVELGITEHMWKLADNNVVLINIAELKTAHALAIVAKGALILGD